MLVDIADHDVTQEFLDNNKDNILVILNSEQTDDAWQFTPKQSKYKSNMEYNTFKYFGKYPIIFEGDQSRIFVLDTKRIFDPRKVSLNTIPQGWGYIQDILFILDIEKRIKTFKNFELPKPSDNLVKNDNDEIMDKLFTVA